MMTHTQITSRQRVATALAHKEPDRVPMDLGGTLASGINYHAYQELLEYLGIEEKWEWDAERSQTVRVSAAVRRRLNVDVVNVRAPAPASRYWQEGPLECQEDIWKVIWKKPPDGHYYTSHVPFAGDVTLADLEAFAWPDPTEPAWVEGVVDLVSAAREQGDEAVTLNLPVGFIHQTQFLRGYEDWLTDLLLNRKFAESLMDRVLEVHIEIARRLLKLVGDQIDVVTYGDDIGFQGGPMLSEKLYCEMIKPRHRRMFETIKAHTSAPIFFHTCGAVADLVPHLIDIGVDILNPVQVSAVGMDTADLKRKYGQHISFWGAVDTHQVLPYGTEEDVRAEVRRRIDDLATGGGYVLAAVHNIQAGVPPAHVVAMFDEGRLYGRRA